MSFAPPDRLTFQCGSAVRALAHRWRVNINVRGTGTLTGRFTWRAPIAASQECGQGKSLHLKPDPMNGEIVWIDSGASAKAFRVGEFRQAAEQISLVHWRAMNATNRRTFMSQCAGLAAGAWLLPRVGQAAESSAPSVRFPSTPRERVAVAAYPFREFIVGWKGWDGKSPSTVPAAQQIELKDFAAHVAEKFNVHKIEPWSRIFPSTDPKYLEQFRSAVEKAHSAVVDIALDEEHSQYSPDAAERDRAVASSKGWVDVGSALGSPGIRTHVQGDKDVKPDVALAADTLARVAEYGAKKNVVVNLENDDAVSEDPFFIVQVIEKVNNPWLRALPDFGNTLNTHDDDYNYRALDAMFAHAYCICHVKDGEVDEHGKPTHVDLARTFAILKKHEYKGYCSIEYDAPGDPYKPTAELVEKTIGFLS